MRLLHRRLIGSRLRLRFLLIQRHSQILIAAGTIDRNGDGVTCLPLRQLARQIRIGQDRLIVDRRDDIPRLHAGLSAQLPVLTLST